MLTAAEQSKLTPDQILKDFMEGNERLKNWEMILREHSEEIWKNATGVQFPKAMVLSCLDSRVPVKNVFDPTNMRCFCWKSGW